MPNVGMPNVGTASVDLEVDGQRLGRSIRGAVDGQSSGISGAFHKIGGQAGDAISAGFRSTLNIAKNVGAAAGVAGVALGAFGLKVAGDFQQTRISFEGILGSAEKAQAFLTTLRDFAAKTPFEFPELATAAKSLLAVGFNADDVIPIMTKLGNTAAALGVGGEAINGVVRALGQMKGKGKASAEELNQISEQIPGFSAVKAIAEDMGISVEEAFKQMEKGAIPADRAISAILKGMERFPGAAGAMQRQSKTLNGVISTIKDTFRDALINGIEPFLPAIASGLEKAAPKLKTAMEGIVGAVKTAIGVVGQLFTIFTKRDFTGGPFAEDSPIIAGVFKFRDAMAAVVGWVRENWPQIKKIIGETMTTIKTVVAGVVDVITTIWRNFGDQITAVVKAAWEFVQTTIKGALDVIQGIVKVVTGIIHGDWSQVWEGIKQIFNGAWDAMVGRVKFAIEIVKQTISAGWEVVKSVFGGTVEWIGDRVEDLVGFFTGLPGRIGRAVVGMWDGIKDAFRHVINTIIGWWNSLDFTLPKIHIPGTNIDFGGQTVGMPDIPTIGGGGDSGHPHAGSGLTPDMAEGGLVRARPGGTIIRAGEAGEDEWVIPASKIGTHAAFDSAGAVIDYDLFAQAVARALLGMSIAVDDRRFGEIVDRTLGNRAKSHA